MLQWVTLTTFISETESKSRNHFLVTLTRVEKWAKSRVTASFKCKIGWLYKTRMALEHLSVDSILSSSRYLACWSGVGQPSPLQRAGGAW